MRTEQAIPEDVAADTSYALQQVTAVGTGTNANVIGRPIAGKTGTATTDGGNVRSSWFVGYTPQLSTAVMYTRGNGNQPLNGFLDTFYGGEYPARTWAVGHGRRPRGGGDPRRSRAPAYLERPSRATSPTRRRRSPTPEPSPTPTETVEPTREPEPEPSAEAPATTAPPSSPPPSESGPPRTSPSPAEPPGGGGARDDASQHRPRAVPSPASDRSVACSA